MTTNNDFHGINNADDLNWIGIHDLHDAYNWFNDHIQTVPQNADRVLRVAQTIWTSYVDANGRWSAVNASTGRVKRLPVLHYRGARATRRMEIESRDPAAAGRRAARLNNE